ncbi:MAG TPA: hypothetical protein VGR56_06850 [Nitrososphaerales archaeon]|nr:hypothetical protein [Nitrososphaerales archaeon]
MGLITRIAAALICVFSFSSGLWLVGILSLLYLAFSFRPRTKCAQGASKAKSRLQFRTILGVGLFLLSLVAFGEGGTYSPILLFLAGLVAFSWPHLPIGSVFAQVVPIEGSILLRSKHLPFLWYALAEVKPGPEDFPRAASSISGRLVIFVDSARVYTLAECRELSRNGAEAHLISRLKDSASYHRSRAYILPLEAKFASGLLLHRFSATKIPEDLATDAAGLPDLLMVQAHAGRIEQASGYKITAPAGSPTLPLGCKELKNRPLLWELFESVGKRSRWPGPDAYSNLLDSVMATRGEPIGERLGGIEGSGGSVIVQSLGGEKLELSRPQLRAIVSIYS